MLEICSYFSSYFVKHGTYCDILVMLHQEPARNFINVLLNRTQMDLWVLMILKHRDGVQVN